MPIQIIIFLMKTRLFACEVNSNGKAETISIKGNSEIKCEGKESIDELIECLYDAFNIDDFADDNFDIVIVESGPGREIIKYLDTKCAGTSKFNIISMEKVLPFIASNKNLIKAEDEVNVTFADQFYKIACNENGVVKIGKARKTEDAIALEENDFSSLYHFITNIIAVVMDESKLEEAREENATLQRKLRSYETELEELREVQKQFIALQKNQKKQEEEKEQADAIYQKAKKFADDELYDKAFELYQKAADMGSIGAIGRPAMKSQADF